MLGGVPQGSLLGVFLFNLAIDCFELGSPDVEHYSPPVLDPIIAPDGPLDQPVPPEPSTRDSRHTTPFRRVPIGVSKYVDDIIQNEKLNFDTVTIDGAAVKDKLAIRSGNLFNRISYQATAIGMLVHTGKTQYCIVLSKPKTTSREHISSIYKVIRSRRKAT